MHAHLLTRCESSQLLDLGGLVVAAPSAQQDLAAHPLLRLCRVTGTGHTAHHMVQVLHVLCRDRLVVVSILGGRGPGQWAHSRMFQIQTSLLCLSLHERAAAFLLMLTNTEPQKLRCREATQHVPQGRLWGALCPHPSPWLCPLGVHTETQACKLGLWVGRLSLSVSESHTLRHSHNVYGGCNQGCDREQTTYKAQY